MEGDEMRSAERHDDDEGWSGLSTSDLRFDPVSVVSQWFCPLHTLCPAILYIRYTCARVQCLGCPGVATQAHV